MKKKYLVRLDDASPTMAEERWMRVYEVLKRHGVLPLVGVIPNNEDPTQQNPIIPDFWKRMRQWQSDGTTIAMHGYNHCYDECDGGLNPLWRRSEFVGKSKEVQSKKIIDGYKILTENGLTPKVFFAPSHTYDLTTIECLKEFTPIRIISDTMAFNPYSEYGMMFVPQQSGHFVDIPLPGTWTFCFHPNTMEDDDIARFDEFISSRRSLFMSFADIDLSRVKSKNILDVLLRKLYFLKRGKR